MRAYAAAIPSLQTLLLFAALLALGSSNPVSAQIAASGDVRIIYWVDNDVGSSYTASVMLTNMTDADIPMWTLEFDLDPAATGIRQASFELAGNHHTVSGQSWNKLIPAGESVWFHIDGFWYGLDIPAPTGCVFNGEACTFEGVPEEEPEPPEEVPVDVAFWVAEEGVTEFRTQILIRNRTENPIEDWTMSFRSQQLITRMEHVEWTRSGDDYEVTPKRYFYEIEPNEIIWYTLEGVHYGKVDSLTACVFDGFDCEFLTVEELLAEAEEEAEEFELSECQIPASEVPEVPVEDIDIEVDIQLWQTGYTIAMELTNNGQHALRDWEIEFTLPLYQTIERFWNAEVERNGTSVTVSSLIYNSCLEPGASQVIGFEGQHDGRADKPSGCIFGGEDCVFSRLLAPLATASEDGPALPDFAFDLGPPYPNPVTDSATIPFKVDRTQNVDLVLWDLQGRQVATLFQGPAMASESYEARLSMGSLPAGAYFVRLTGEHGGSVGRPLLLVR